MAWSTGSTNALCGARKAIIAVGTDGEGRALVDRCDLFSFRSRHGLAQLVSDTFGVGVDAAMATWRTSSTRPRGLPETRRRTLWPQTAQEASGSASRNPSAAVFCHVRPTASAVLLGE